ncbi:F-box protein [Musa troglodytarum]|uniref:F-box protein n=1 Tax=Musa troglodytarum TaxID=320322 RepID=A0A9E7FCN7_9LILI|nr:F-box protein [Musa troglodytarum]
MPPRSEPMETAAAEEEETRGAEPKVEEMEPLIPGLPDEVAEQCLLHLPFPYQSLARSVSSSWNRALSSPSFIRSKAKAAAALSLPYLFVFAFDRSTLRLQWQALDCRTSRWFCGDGRVKAYDEGTDRWRAVAGGAVPAEVKRPYAVTGGGAGEDGRIYVVGSGLDVGVGTVVPAAGGRGAVERVEWQVVKGPPAFADLAPCNALVLYA